MKNLSIALVHYPVYNKKRELIATSVTNLDIHDIARCAKTYGVKKYFIVHPAKVQQEFINEMTNFWSRDYGRTYNADRSKALETVEVVSDLDEIKQYYDDPVFVVTSAKQSERGIGIHNLAQTAAKDSERDYVILFGTGWGLADQVIDQATYVLNPLIGTGEYNHLSVRSAVAIILDRLHENY